MSAKNKSLFGNIIWYASGSSLKDLAKSHLSYSEFIGIGGLNIFSTILIGIISSWSSSKFFINEPFFLHLFIGVIASFLVFSINRQSIMALILMENIEKKKRNSFNLLPIYLFAIVVGLIISFPIKFYVFGVDFISKNHNILDSISELDKITDVSATPKLISWSISLFLILLILSPTLVRYFSIRSNYQKETSSFLNEFMWFCSGANKEIVRRCPNEHSKYFGIGGTILFTALMASLSGGYAITTVFDSVTAGIFFGIFWGLLIFNLDRFIVNTMYSDGKHTISIEELFGGLPRLVIAIFLGIVISYPIELRIFESEINKQMEISANKEAFLNDSISRITQELPIKNMEKTNISIEKQIITLQDEIKDAKSTADNFAPKTKRVPFTTDSEGNPIYRTVNTNGYNNALNNYKRVNDENLKQISVLRGQLSKSLSEININQQHVDSVSKGKIIIFEKAKGLSTRMKAFSKLKDDEPSTEIASIFIMLLFIIIEISPVLFKMMMSAGDYDLILKTEKDKIRTNEIERLSRINDSANTEIQKVIEENKIRVLQKQNELDTEFKANEALLKEISEAQVELAKIAVEKWKAQELIKIEQDPNYFIKSAVK